MPESSILTEFLVEIGWNTNEQAQKKFIGAIREGSFEADLMASAVEKAAGSIVHFAQEMQIHFENLFLQSKELHTSANNIEAFGKGFEIVGVKMDTARGGLESFATAIRKLPGYLTELQERFNIDPKADRVEQYKQLLVKLHDMKFSGDKNQVALAERYQQQFGIPEQLITQIDEAIPKIEELQKQLNSLFGPEHAKHLHELGTAFRDAKDQLEHFADAALDGAWGEALTKTIKGITKAMQEESPHWKENLSNLGSRIYDIFGLLVPGKYGDQARKDFDQADFKKIAKQVVGKLSAAFEAIAGETPNSWFQNWIVPSNWDDTIKPKLKQIADGFKALVLDPIKGDMTDLKQNFTQLGNWITDHWVPTLLQAWKQLGEAWTNLMRLFGFGASTAAITGGIGSGSADSAHGGGAMGGTISDGRAGGSYSGRTGPHGGQKSLLLGGSGQGKRTKPGGGAETGEGLPTNADEIEHAFNAATKHPEWPGPGLSKTDAVTDPNGQTWNVAPQAASAFQAFINEMHEKHPDYPLISAGGYNDRNKRGGGTPSMHAYGTAIDINAGKNPFGATQNDFPADTAAIAARHGIAWGANFSGKKDAMHFEYTGITPKFGPSGTTKPDLTNNPGDIHYPGSALDYQKLFGGTKSDQTDQGDPLYQFPNLRAGFDAMAALARKKYANGLRTINEIIAGKGGLTPGNMRAAGNIAKGMGIDPNEDVHGFSDDLMRKFQSAYGRQEGSNAAVDALEHGEVYGNDRIKKINEGLKKAATPKTNVPHGAYHSNVDPHAFGANIMGGGGDTNNTHNQHVTIHVNGAEDAHKVAQLVHHEIQTAHARAVRNMIGNVA